MKFIFKNRFKQPQQIISALVLTGILSLGSGLTLLQSATATPRNLSQEAAGEMVKGKSYEQARPMTLPPTAVLLPGCATGFVLQGKNPASNLRITNFSQETWADGLGLPGADEFCTQGVS